MSKAQSSRPAWPCLPFFSFFFFFFHFEHDPCANMIDALQRLEIPMHVETSLQTGSILYRRVTTCRAAWCRQFGSWLKCWFVSAASVAPSFAIFAQSTVAIYEHLGAQLLWYYPGTTSIPRTVRVIQHIRHEAE